MKEISEWLLSKIVSSDSYNKVAQRLLEIIENGSEISKIDWLTLFVGATTDGTNHKKANPLQIDNEKSRDCRIKEVKIRGFRKYPYRKDGYYTLNFTDSKSNDPCSCFFIGSNGSGKTSIFSSLQETCSDSFTAADSRCVERKVFMPHIGRNNDFVDVIVETKLGEIYLQNPSESELFPIRMLFRPFFCSEYDIRMMSESKDITNYIVKQTGFNHTFNLIEHLNNIYEECRKLKDYLEKSKKENLLSDRDTIRAKQLKYDFLNSVFDDIVEYRYRYKTKSNRPSLSGLIEKLKRPLKIKAINSNSKNFLNDILKAGKLLPDLLDWLKKEQELLQRLNLLNGDIEKAYHSIIFSITDLQIDYEDFKSDDSDDIEIKRLIFKNIRMNSLYGRFKSLGLPDFNIKRRFFSDLLQNLQASISDGEKPKTFVENLLKEINSYKETIQDKDFSDADKLELIEKNIGKLKECIDSLQRYYVACLTKSSVATKAFCEMVLEHFNMNDEHLEITVNDKTGKLDIKYKINGCYIDPILYLNSFRFKLYTLCLKIGMAFSVMQLLKISFPIVLDDVFYSSDFSNRENVCFFIREIFELYNEKIKPKTGLPLQIIFFTHDEVVLEAAVNGMEGLDESFKYGRVFNYQEMEDKNEEGNSNCSLSVIFVH